jgi:Uma2 family endonuclease
MEYASTPADLLALAVRERPFTVEEYHLLTQAGILGEDDRIELLGGRLITMSPIGSKHLHCVNRLEYLFGRRLYTLNEPPARLSIQNPLRLDDRSEPEPDVVLLRPDAPQNRTPIPEDVLLLIEVADTTLAYDRQTKRPRYATAGVPEVWIVALEEETVQVCRRPMGNDYGELITHPRGASLTVAALPDVEPTRVDEVLGETGAASG